MKDRLCFRAALASSLFVLVTLTGCANLASSSAAATAGQDDRGLVGLWASDQVGFGYYVTGMPYTVETGRELAANHLLDFAFVNLERDYAFEKARDVAEGLRSEGEEAAMIILVRIPPM